jgi:hypothetical protein
MIPSAGSRKIYLKDVSEGGLAFLAEPTDEFEEGTKLEGYFYLNPTLRLPLALRVANVNKLDEGGRRVGCEFAEKSSKAFKVFQSFLGLLDDLSTFVDT